MASQISLKAKYGEQVFWVVINDDSTCAELMIQVAKRYEVFSSSNKLPKISRDEDSVLDAPSYTCSWIKHDGAKLFHGDQVSLFLKDKDSIDVQIERVVAEEADADEDEDLLTFESIELSDGDDISSEDAGNDITVVDLGDSESFRQSLQVVEEPEAILVPDLQEFEMQMAAFLDNPSQAKLTVADLPEFQQRDTEEYYDDFEYEDEEEEEMPDHPIGWAEGTYPFTAEEPDEINFVVGSIIAVYIKRDDGWWKGCVKDNPKIGYFPGNRVKEIPDPVSSESQSSSEEEIIAIKSSTKKAAKEAVAAQKAAQKAAEEEAKKAAEEEAKKAAEEAAALNAAEEEAKKAAEEEAKKAAEEVAAQKAAEEEAKKAAEEEAKKAAEEEAKKAAEEAAALKAAEEEAKKAAEEAKKAAEEETKKAAEEAAAKKAAEEEAKKAAEEEAKKAAEEEAKKAAEEVAAQKAAEEAAKKAAEEVAAQKAAEEAAVEKEEAAKRVAEEEAAARKAKDVTTEQTSAKKDAGGSEHSSSSPRNNTNPSQQRNFAPKNLSSINSAKGGQQSPTVAQLRERFNQAPKSSPLIPSRRSRIHTRTRSISKPPITLANTSDTPGPQTMKLYYKGVELVASNRLDSGVKKLDKCILACPRFAEAYCLRGEAHMKMGDLQEALKDLNRALQLKPKLLDAALLRAFLALKARRLEVARQGFLSAKGLGAVARAEEGLGWIALKQNKFDEAIRHFTLAVDADPKLTTALGGRGHAYRLQGDVKAAIEDLKTAVKQTPKLHEAWLQLALVLVSVAQWDAALVSFTHVLQGDPDSLTALSGKAVCHRQRKEYLECRKTLTTALEKYPGDVQLRERRGACALAMRDFEAARLDFALLCDANVSSSASVIQGHATALLALKRAEEALALLRQNTSPPKLLLAEALLKSGESKEALPLLEELAAGEQAAHQVFLFLSLARVAAGDRPGALQAAQRVLQMKPKDKQARHLVKKLTPQ